MSQKFEIILILAILSAFCASNPTTTEPVELTTTEESANDENSPPDYEETQAVYTGPVYEMILTAKGAFSDDLKDKNSKKFKKFSSNLDAELIYVIEEHLGANLAAGQFRVFNVLPSNLPGFLYISILIQISDEDAIKWEKAIERRIQERGILAEMEAVMQGYSWIKVKRSDLWMYEKHTECQSDFCIDETSTESPFPPSAPGESLTSNSCKPREEIQRGSTSIYIFEDQNCLEHVKSHFSPSSAATCGVSNDESKQVPEETIESSEVDPMTPQASEHRHQFAMPSGAVEGFDDQTVVVVKKRGNKVFIEI